MLYMAHDTFLCNQMFPFANVISFAFANNETVIYPSFSKHAGDFPFFAENRLCQFPQEKRIGGYWKLLARSNFSESQFLRVNHKVGFIPHILMTPEQIYDFELQSNERFNERITASKGAILDGLYFLSNSNFIQAKATIKRIFAPSSEVLRIVDACISRARENTDILIGTHMRFGDYLSFKRDMAYNEREYYEVIRKLKNLFNDFRTTFLLCSDRKQNPRDFPDVRALAAPGSTVADLYCLSRCDLIVGPPSTFSQWASFYGDVPIFNINYKNEIKHGLPVTEPNTNSFYVHHAGFGRHSIRKKWTYNKARFL